MLNYTKCLICGQIVDASSHFYKIHKIRQCDYYYQYYNKKDLFTGKPITFKSEDQYILSDFNDRNSLKGFIKENPKNIVFDYLSSYLTKRATIKGYLYSPSYIETRTLMFPAIPYLEKTYGPGSYAEIVGKSKTFLRFDYNKRPIFGEKVKHVICDTREAKILPFSNAIIQKLDFGDYCGDPGNGVYIERKSLGDLLGTLSLGYDRFIKELNRCKSNNQYMVILIEEPLERLLSFNHQQYIHSKASPEFIFSRIRKINQDFPRHCQFLCVDDRQKAVEITLRLFSITNVPELDLQYLYEICKL